MLNHVKNTTIISPLDLLAPHSCRGCRLTGSPLCDRCKKYILSNHISLCPICKTPNTTGKCETCINLPPTFIVGERSDLIASLIHDFKYNSVRALARPLAELINKTLPAFPNQVIIVPLPTISRHIRERGFDHTLLIAKHLAKLRGPRCQVSKLLIRHQNTVQVGADYNTRLSQASSAYAIAKNTNINPSATYLLLDDVWTTGASMQAAIQKLQQVGITNLAIAILALNRIS